MALAVENPKSHLRDFFGFKPPIFHSEADYSLTPVPFKPYSEPLETPISCVRNLNRSSPLKLTNILNLLGNDIYKTVDIIFSDLVTALTLKRLGYFPTRNYRLYKVILKYFGPFQYTPLRLRKYSYYIIRLDLSSNFKVRKCFLRTSRVRFLNVLYRLLNSCLYIKRSILGFSLSIRDIHSVIYYITVEVVDSYKSKNSSRNLTDVQLDKSNWDTVEILESSTSFGYVRLCNFISKVLFKNKDLGTLVSRASTWSRFDTKYIKETLIVLLFINSLKVKKSVNKIFSDFKKALNFNFNYHWNIMASVNTNDLNIFLPYVTLFHSIINNETRTFNPPSIDNYELIHIGCLIPKNLILDDKYNLAYVRYVILVAKSLLKDPSISNILSLIELFVHYFSYSTLKFGFLKCSIPYNCLRCTSIFTEVYCGLINILERMRQLSCYYPHLNLIRMLIKNELNRLKTSFFVSFIDEDISDFLINYTFKNNLIPDILERNLVRSHYSPKYSKYLKYLFCFRLLKKCLDNRTAIFIKENILTSSSKCSWYLMLLFCVDNHVKSVEPSMAINKTLSNSTYRHLEHLSYKPPRNYGYKFVYCGNNMLNDQFEIIYNLYVGKQTIHQYLDAFDISDKLNIIQRTQSCLVLSKNLDYVEMVLEQLVQALIIDPGDRILNLLYISLNDYNVTSKIFYHLSCLLHSNINNSTNHKIFTFIRFIFNLLSENDRNIYGNQILLHGQLLNLTLKLGELPFSKRYTELSKKILEISDTINNQPNLYLYKDSSDILYSGNNEIPMSSNEGSLIGQDSSVHFEPNSRVFKSIASQDKTNNGQTQFTFDHNQFSCTYSRSYSDESKLNLEYSDQDFDESARIVGINLNSVKILNSATRAPFMVSYKLSDGSERTYIYKMKDDLRQDCLAIQMKQFLLQIFYNHELFVYLRPFLVIPYSGILFEIFSDSKINDISLSNYYNSKFSEIGGVVGFIPDTISRHHIGKEFGVPIKDFFLKRFGHQFSPNYIKAVDNFITSLAGYALLSFLLQVKDRHNGNLLFTTSGHIIHIDFGFILGASPAKDLQFELAPFKFTPEMVDFMGGSKSDNFKRFIHLLLNSYMALRTHSNLIITLVKLLQRRLRLNDSPNEAKEYIMRKIYYALNSKTTKLYDYVQSYQQGIEH
uniref:Phosphatidylinositol 4-kinase, putative n=1 Tax=Theileria annulata TaxID=5874 RepID=A0A3B0NFM1_THEAN